MLYVIKTKPIKIKEFVRSSLFLLSFSIIFLASLGNAYTEQVFSLNYTESETEDDIVIGGATELVRAIFEESGLSFDINIASRSRAIHFIDTQENVLVFSMSHTPKREALYHWIGEIYPSKVMLFGRREDANRLPKTTTLAP
jgi:hypothetical protein